MLSRRERAELTALGDEMGQANPASAQLYQRSTQITLQLARHERNTLILRGLGVVALCVASGTASPYVVVVLTVVTLALAPLLCRDWIRQRNKIAEERRDRVTRWHNNRPRMIADVRDEIANGPTYALRTEFFHWNWRSLSWWTAQLANIVCTVSVALTLVAFDLVTWLALILAGVYAVFLWTMESLLFSTFVLQRKAVLDGLLPGESRRNLNGESPQTGS